MAVANTCMWVQFWKWDVTWSACIFLFCSVFEIFREDSDSLK